jgi:hypothetical protein
MCTVYPTVEMMIEMMIISQHVRNTNCIKVSEELQEFEHWKKKYTSLR